MIALILAIVSLAIIGVIIIVATILITLRKINSTESTISEYGSKVIEIKEFMNHKRKNSSKSKGSSSRDETEGKNGLLGVKYIHSITFGEFMSWLERMPITNFFGWDSKGFSIGHDPKFFNINDYTPTTGRVEFKTQRDTDRYLEYMKSNYNNIDVYQGTPISLGSDLSESKNSDIFPEDFNENEEEGYYMLLHGEIKLIQKFSSTPLNTNEVLNESNDILRSQGINEYLTPRYIYSLSEIKNRYKNNSHYLYILIHYNANTRYVVTCPTSVNVRRGDNILSPILYELPNGARVNVRQTANGWCEIGDNQWVSSAYLRKEKSST